jgi:glycosyltransferase involved in cell wall biosynthesis
MHIVIAHHETIPVFLYGGIERVNWCLGKEFVKMGHQVTFLVKKGSHCDFAKVAFIDETRPIASQIPEDADVVHLNAPPDGPMATPYIVMMQGNCNDQREFDLNTVFVSKNHANRFGSDCFVHNGLDWDDYGDPGLNQKRSYFHFLGKAAWRLKNVQGAIDVVLGTPSERLNVLGGYRLNLSMGFRLTLHPRISFSGMVGGERKNALLRASKGLIFPVRWHEPFGLAITESMYFGCPVFSTPYGSLPELVPAEAGFLSDKQRELSEQIQHLETYDRAKIHQYATDVFNSKIMADAYLSKYETVLNGRTLNARPPRLLQMQTEKFLNWE